MDPKLTPPDASAYPPSRRKFSVVILSANPRNLRICVSALAKAEPDLFPNQVIVVDDGARTGYAGPSVRWVGGVKPFVYSRNANIGISAAGEDDIVLLNDDAEIMTAGGFSLLSRKWGSLDKVAAASPVVKGIVGNGEQSHSYTVKAKRASWIAFVCPYIRRAALKAVGPLDERFVAYGRDDSDWSKRALSIGMELWVDPACVVGHEIHCVSTFRSKPNIRDLSEEASRIWRRKWGGP